MPAFAEYAVAASRIVTTLWCICGGDTLTKEQLRSSIAQVCYAIFAIRNPAYWGEGVIACASDSEKFGAGIRI
jgi:TnpA family transposase